MPRRRFSRHLRQFIEQLRPRRSQERQKTKRPLLRRTQRKQRLQQNPLMLFENASPKSLRRPNLPPQFQKLINHLPFSSPQSPQQSLVEFSQRLLKFLQKPPQRFLIRIKSPRQSPRQRSRRQQSPYPLPPAKHILERQCIFLHQARHVRLNQSKSSPRQNRRHPGIKLAINHFDLRHVRYFCGPAHISCRRQKRILHNRPQQNIRRKNLRSHLNRSMNFVASKRFPAFSSHHKFPAAHAHRLAAPIHIHKKQRRLAGNFHLRMKSSLIERLPASQQFITQRFRILNSPPENRRRDPVQAAIQRIKQNHPAPGQQASKQFPECRSKRFANRIRFAQGPFNIRRKRPNKPT